MYLRVGFSGFGVVFWYFCKCREFIFFLRKFSGKFFWGWKNLTGWSVAGFADSVFLQNLRNLRIDRVLPKLTKNTLSSSQIPPRGWGGSVCRANVSFFRDPAPDLFRSLFLVRASFGSKLWVFADEIMVLQIFADFHGFRRFSQIFADFCRFLQIYHPVCDACDRPHCCRVCVCFWDVFI